jgi:hypothetical protein
MHWATPGAAPTRTRDVLAGGRQPRGACVQQPVQRAALQQLVEGLERVLNRGAACAVQGQYM